MDWILLLFSGWFAATVSGAAGFGGALLLLPLITHSIGAKAAVPVLTIAQLSGNLSRAGFGYKDIRWRPVLLFCTGAVPASALGSRLFVELPSSTIMKVIGIFLVLAVVLRHTPFKNYRSPDKVLPAAGAVVGFLSAVAGSAGPLGAAVFLSLQLPAVAYVASEAVTASFIHITKSVVFGKYMLLKFSDLLLGLALSGSMILGSFTGRKLIQRLSEKHFDILVEVLLVFSAISLFIR